MNESAFVAATDATEVQAGNPAARKPHAKMKPDAMMIESTLWYNATRPTAKTALCERAYSMVL